jgi:outer membrane protein assembly factor BamB
MKHDKHDDSGQDAAHLFSQHVMRRLGLATFQKFAEMPLEELSVELANPDSSVRAAALRALAMYGEQVPVEWLVKAMQDSHWLVRERAIRTLGKRGKFVPLEPLLAALHDEDASVRAAAVHVLGTHAGNVPTGSLESALWDSDWHVRETAALVLQNMRDQTPETLWQRAAGNSNAPAHPAEMFTTANTEQEIIAPVNEAIEQHTLASSSAQTNITPFGRIVSSANNRSFIVPHREKHSPIDIQAFQRERENRMRNNTISRHFTGNTISQRLGIVAAVLFAVLLVGSMAFVFGSLHHAKSPLSTTTASGHPTQANHTAAPSSASGVYISSLETGTSNRLSRLNIQNGKLIWKSDVQQEYPSQVVNGVIYTTYEDPNSYVGEVLAYSASNGSLLWQNNLGSDFIKVAAPLPGPNAYTITDLGEPSPAVVANGIVYVTRTDGKVFALRASNGSLLWTLDTHTQDYANGTNYNPNPVAVNGNVLYDTVHNKLFAINAANGTVSWSVAIDSSLMFNAPQFMDGAIYTSSDSASLHTPASYIHYVYSFSTKDGSQNWNKLVKTTSLPLTLMTTTANGIVYYVSGNSLYALNASNSSELWTQALGGSVDFNTPVIANGTLYIYTSGNQPTLFALNATTGSQIWHHQMNVWSLAASNNVVYVGIDHALLLALDAKSGAMLWQRSFFVPAKDKMGDSMARVFTINIVP